MDSTQQAIQRLEQKVDTIIILLAQILKAIPEEDEPIDDAWRDPSERDQTRPL